LIALYDSVDSVLVHAYDAREAGLPTHDLSEARPIFAVAGECGRALADHLYQLLGAIADPLNPSLDGFDANTIQLAAIQCDAPVVASASAGGSPRSKPDE
jgi:hypothetical protein